VLVSFIHSHAFQPGDQDLFDQGLSQKVMVVRIVETQVLQPTARALCVLYPVFNVMHRHSPSSGELSKYLYSVLFYWNYSALHISAASEWHISGGAQSNLHLDLLLKIRISVPRSTSCF